MRYDRPDFQLDGNASGSGTISEAGGVIAQNFVVADMDEKRWKAGEIGVERRREGIAGIGVAKIVACGCRDVGAAEHGAAIGVGSNRVTGRGKIGPGRKDGCGCRKRKACGPQSEQERECKTTAGGLPRNDDALRSVARAEKRTIDRYGVIHSGWKLIFGCEPIVRCKHAKPLERKENSDGTMRLRRAGEVSSPVKIEEHSIVRRRAFEALARDAAELYGRNMDGGRNFVRVGMKDSPRNAIIPHTFQAAFYAPLNDPHRKPGLEASRHSLPPHLEFWDEQRISDSREG